MSLLDALKDQQKFANLDPSDPRMTITPQGVQRRLDGADLTALSMLNMRSTDDPKPADGETVGQLYFPNATDYGQIPSDLIRDELLEMEFFRTFVEQFKGLFANDETRESASEFLRVLGQYMAGEAKLEDLKEVDVSDLMGVEGFSDYYNSVTTPPSATGDSDSTFLQGILDQMPDDMRQFIEDIGEDPFEVLKRILDSMPDIADQLKRGQVGVEIIFEDWKNKSNVFGPFIIPGLPLPPGIMDITFEDIENAVDKIGGSIVDVFNDLKEDPLGTIEGLIEKAGTWVKGIFGGIGEGEDDPFGGTLGGFEDWVRGIFGSVIGGSVLVDIYDSVSGFFDPDDGTLIPGGPPDEEDEDETLSLDDNDDDLFGDPEILPASLPDLYAPDSDGGYGPKTDPGGDNDGDPEIPGGDDDDEDPDIPGGGGGGGLNYQDDPDIPGGAPTGGGGGGGGGGSRMGQYEMTDFPFGITADPQLLARSEFPVVDYLFGPTGLLTNKRLT